MKAAIKELVTECLDLSIEINLNNEFMAFFKITPHVNWVEIYVTSKDDYNSKVYDFRTTYDTEEYDEFEILLSLRECKKTLKQILKEVE